MQQPQVIQIKSLKGVCDFSKYSFTLKIILFADSYIREVHFDFNAITVFYLFIINYNPNELIYSHYFCVIQFFIFLLSTEGVLVGFFVIKNFGMAICNFIT